MEGETVKDAKYRRQLEKIGREIEKENWVMDYLKTHFEEITKSVGNFDQLKDGNVKIKIRGKI